jgi:predicted outer membrane repeat protein
MSTWTSRACAFAIALAGSLSLATNACATANVIFNVNSIADTIDDDTSDGLCHTVDNTCTLRAATMSANKATGTGVIINLPAGIYTLIRPAAAPDGDDNGDINLAAAAPGDPFITISGAGANSTIIDANYIDRVLSVGAGRIATLSGVTLRNGLSDAGGGIASAGALTLSHVTLSNNASSIDGGGIYSASSPLHVNDSTFDHNTAFGSGGGIWCGGGVTVTNSVFNVNIATSGKGGGIFTVGTLDLDHSTFTGNKSGSDGGGIYAFTGPITVNYSTLSGNSATNGGGIYAEGSATLTVNHSTLGSTNKADDSGGGIYIAGSLTLSYSTLSGNTADVGGGMASVSGTANSSQSTISGNAARLGGGIDNSANLYVTNSTISLNNADADGGGIRNISVANVYNSTIVGNQVDADINVSGTGGGFFNGGTFTLRNSVVAGNYSSGLSSFHDDCSGVVNTYGRNKYFVAGGGSACTIVQHAPGSDTLLDSLGELGPLQDNGGPTLTIALVAPSNMIDGAESTVGCIDNNGALLYDQRGFPRVAGVRCDIGAFEYGIIFANGFDF